MNDNASEQNGNNMLENDPLQFHFSLHKEIDQDIREELSVLRVDDPNANRFMSRLISIIHNPSSYPLMLLYLYPARKQLSALHYIFSLEICDCILRIP